MGATILVFPSSRFVTPSPSPSIPDPTECGTYNGVRVHVWAPDALHDNPCQCGASRLPLDRIDPARLALPGDALCY